MGSYYCQCAAAALFLQVPKFCTDLNGTLLYILMFKTCSNFARKYEILALDICFPQTCSSASHVFAVSRSHLACYWPIGSFPQEQSNQMLRKLDSSENPHSFRKSQAPSQRQIGCFSNKHGCSVESSLQGVSLKSFLWRRTKFVGSNMHVILTRQTRVQCSSSVKDNFLEFSAPNYWLMLLFSLHNK